MVAAFLATGALGSACGAKHPPTSDNSLDLDGGASGGFADTTTKPECETYVDGGPCGCLELSLLSDVPNLYFVLDRSGSMDEDGKLTSVRVVMAKVVQQLGPRGTFGAAIFPDPHVTDGCSAGVEVFAPKRGDSPAGKAGPTVLGLIGATNVVAAGGTPTAATLRALLPRITSLGGRTFVILATDGGPNCDTSGSCDASSCIPNIESAGGCSPQGPNCCDPSLAGPGNCLDTQPTIDAVTALANAGVPTYVIGVPGSGPYSGLLDQLATAGGTARASSPKYFRVDSPGESGLTLALSEIAAKITASCVLPLTPSPPDPNRVNVYFDDVPVPPDPVNGWKLEGDTVTLLGDACSKVLSGQVLNLRVIAGCPTVPPK